MGLYLSIAFPSLGQVHKYLGVLGVFLYAALTFLAIFVIYKYRLGTVLSKITDRQAFFMAILTVTCLAIIFFVVYPVVNADSGAQGSDRDEDVNLAATELLHLRYPYYPETYLGNAITHLPGSILLSIPFVLLGNSAFGNFFWLFIFFIVARAFLKDARSALMLFWIILFLSPAVMREFLTGGDIVANSIYILFFIFYLVHSVSGAKKWQGLFAAVLLGIGLSSRANFLLLLPLVFSCLVQNAGLVQAVKYTGLTITTFLAVTLPFYLYDPAGFSPLYWQFNKVNMFRDVLPFSGLLITFSGVSIALILAFRRMKNDCVALFINCAVCQFFLVLSVFVLAIIKAVNCSILWSEYGIIFLFFGALPFWYMLTRDASL